MSSAEPILSQYFHGKGCRLGLPVAGTFELTPRCNFNCKMCYVHLSAEETARRGRELSADEWLSIAEDARKRGMLFLLLTGGEPLVREDFKYLYSELSKMGFMISINTNGSMLGGEWTEFFLKNPPSRFNISLYGGSDDTYERLCGNRRYHEVTENILRLKEAGAVIRLNVSMGPYNAEDMDDILRFGERAGIPIKPTAYLYPPIRLEEENAGKNAGRFDPLSAARCEFECDVKRFDRETFIKRTKAIAEGIKPASDGEDCDGIPSEGITCRAGKSSFWITWDGKMTPCGMMTEPAAHPLSDGFDAAWEATRDAASLIRMPAECTACSVRHVCHVCAASCLAETGSFSKKPQYICDMVAETARIYKAEYEKMIKNGEIEQ